MTDPKKKRSLSNTDIKSDRGLGRRAFMLGSFGGAAALASTPASALTDSDSGRYADPVGQGTYTGVSDSDGGAYADPAGRGRRRRRRSVTDSDTGRYADPVGRGRGNSGITDADGGRYADPVGRGRG